MADEDLRTLGGRYEIHRRLARGGMAQVYLARDRMLDRPVAVKELATEFATDQTFVERFRREAQAAANLAHPSIVGVYDWGAQDGTYFIVMEYIEGPSLAQVIRRDGPLHPRRAAEITAEVAAALGFAHSRGVVHRDVKPGNVLLTGNGEAKVTDFGIARALSSVDEELTQAGSVMGTATYFSPEQAQGLPVDPRSDLYSLGVVFYEMATGRPPFSGDTALTIAYHHVRDEPPAPKSIVPDLPDPVDAIILKLLRKDPSQRYASAEDLRADLARFARGEPTNAERDMALLAGAAVGAGVAAAATTVQSAVPLEEDPEELEEGEPTKSRTAWFLAGLFLLLAAVAGFLFWLANDLSSDTVTVPDVVGLDVVDATQRLEDEGFEVATEPVESELEPGRVISQDPEADEEVEEGSEVTLTVSAEAELVTVPNVVDKPQAEAEQLLREEGLTFTIEGVEDANRPAGTVAGQDPAAGTEVERETSVKLLVSQGQGQETVPDVAGSSLSAAQAELQRLGFQVGGPVQEASASVASGNVIRTDPAAGAVIDKGSQVTVVVSSGPETVQVPDVRNQEEAQAIASLKSQGLNATVTTKTVPAGDPAVGRVTSQNPVPGIVVDVGSTVTILVGVAGAETTTTTTTTTTP